MKNLIPVPLTQTNTTLPPNITVKRNGHLRRAQWGCTALAVEQSTKNRAGFPTQRPGETGSAVPYVESGMLVQVLHS